MALYRAQIAYTLFYNLLKQLIIVCIMASSLHCFTVNNTNVLKSCLLSNGAFKNDIV